MSGCSRCPCGGHFEDRTVEVHMTRSGEQLLLKDVVQGVCQQCGSRVYPMEVLERVESAFRDDPVDALVYRLSAVPAAESAAGGA